MSTNPERHGVAVVGAGNIAAAHIDAVNALPKAQLVGVASRTPAGAAALAQAHGVKAYDSSAAAASDPDVDVVAICTPSGAHLEPALEAIAAGKHVIVEKPLEVTVERARRLIAAAEAAGVVLSTVFMSRFADANAYVKHAVDAGELGRLLQGNAFVPWFRGQAYYDSAAWRGTRLLDGGGALMNQAIHQVDLLLWIMGPVSEVFAFADTLAHERIEVEDTLVASLRFVSGALGQLGAATSLWPGRPKSLQLYGDKGLAIVEDDVLVEWRTRSHADDERARSHTDEDRDRVLAAYGGRPTGGSSDPMAISFENHRRQFRDLFAAIEEGRRPVIDGHEGLRSVELIEAVYRSVAERRPVAVVSHAEPY